MAWTYVALPPSVWSPAGKGEEVPEPGRWVQLLVNGWAVLQPRPAVLQNHVGPERGAHTVSSHLGPGGPVSSLRSLSGAQLGTLLILGVLSAQLGAAVRPEARLP